MRKFKRHGAVISTQLTPDEVMLLQSLLAQLIDMIGEDVGEVDVPEPDSEQAAADPFATWAREFEEPVTVAPPEDPAMRRLFPDAYRDDPEASAEFRRFTDRDLRGRKIDDAQTALAQLALTDEGRRELRIAAGEADAWLRTLTNLRLAVAARLGIESAEVAEALADLPDDDPRAYLASVYDWLGFAQETLVGAL